MDGFTIDDLGCLVRRKKYSVCRIIDADFKFLKDASCEFRAYIAAGGNMMSGIARWARDTRRLKRHPERS
jgi:hypothetical protein